MSGFRSITNEEQMTDHTNVTSWSALYNSRKKIRTRFPSIWKVPIIKKINQILIKEIKEGYKILDVGSCNRNLKQKLEERYSNITYKSMDVDTKNNHDYNNMHDIQEQFDVITMFECIEHLTLEEGADTLKEIERVLKPGGILLISTPNTYHPNRYWECTHKVPFRYDELGGFLEMAGLKTEKIYRIYNDVFFARMFRIYITSFIHKYLNVDFVRSILIIARKKG